MSENTAVIDQDVADQDVVDSVQTDQPVEQPAGVAPPAEQPEATAEAVAETAKAGNRYPADAERQRIAQLLWDWQNAGWTRPALEKLIKRVKRVETEDGDVYQLAELGEGDGFYMGGSALWRSRNGNVFIEEVPYLDCVAAAMSEGTVGLDVKATKNPAKLAERLDAVTSERDGLQERLDAAVEAAQAGVDAKNAAGVREALARVLEALVPAEPTGDADGPGDEG